MNTRLEFSSVEIAPDLNEAVTKAKEKIKLASITYHEGTDEIVSALQEELRLYYVATTRAMVELINATHLPEGLIR